MNPVVLAWVILSVVGVIVSAGLARESWLDLTALGRNGNGRRVAAISRLTREGLRVSVHAAYILAGLGALNILPSFRTLIIPILMWGNVALVANSIIDARTRHLLYETRGSEPPIPRE